ncbi:MAG: DNA mismatch repair protein MutS, partial [Clostridia bacterium]|nr:DNA mismatch repair protein MutS [Clostridia bacterium]
LDKTFTSPGARLLRKWVELPLVNTNQIVMRQSAVEELYCNMMLRDELGELLRGILDLERLMSKIVYGSANGRDLRAIASTVAAIPKIKELLSDAKSDEINNIYNQLDELSDIYGLIERAIVDEPPFTVREGGMIKEGYNAEVDRLNSIKSNGSNYIKEIEQREKDATGIPKLKIGYNRVFGYYIEISKSYVSQAPETYMRKQTLTNCERYITEELKELESSILGASDKLAALEYQLFTEVCQYIQRTENVKRIQTTAAALATLDVYLSLAIVAAQNNYIRPEVDYSDIISIKEGRHPVVERFTRDGYFVPNDTMLDTAHNRMILITGPNMAGKSTFMRQVALITLMAQIGSFVPASDARIGVCDKIFTRVGASDDLASGNSTFMLEMNEVAYILKNATKRSLIIYDEIGRGTSTYDGMSIARAVVEYTASKKIMAKTLFATHYHELTALEGEVEGVRNYNIAAKKKGDDITFLRKIVRGATDESYGIEVAKLAGVPSPVIKRAKEVLLNIETENKRIPVAKEEEEGTNLTFEDFARDEAIHKLKNTDLNIL